MGFRQIVDQQYEANNEKKMGVGRIVDQNSDKKRWVYGKQQNRILIKKDGYIVSIMLNSRLGL